MSERPVITRIPHGPDPLRVGGADRLRAVGDAPPGVRARAHRRRRRHVRLRLLPDARRAGAGDRRQDDRPALRGQRRRSIHARPTSTRSTPTTPSMPRGSACAACRSSTSPPGTSPARSTTCRSPPPSVPPNPVRLPATAIVGYPPSHRTRRGRRPGRRAVGRRLAALQSADRPRPRRLRRAAAGGPARRARRMGRLRRQHGVPHRRRRRPLRRPRRRPPARLDRGPRAARAMRRSSPSAEGRPRPRWRWATNKGGSYHPQALLSHDAVDVLRIDLTTNGGITGMPRVLDQARQRRRRRGAAHVSAPPLPRAAGARRHRRADRVGRAGHRRAPDGRLPRAAGRHRRVDGTAGPGRRPRHARQPTSGSPPSRSSTPTACSTTSTNPGGHP